MPGAKPTSIAFRPELFVGSRAMSPKKVLSLARVTGSLALLRASHEARRSPGGKATGTAAVLATASLTALLPWQ